MNINQNKIIIIFLFSLLTSTCIAEEMKASDWNAKGWKLLDDSNYEEAITAFDQAINIDPNISKPWLGKGDALINLKRYSDAVVAYNESIKIEPLNKWGWIGKGNSL